MLTVLLAGTSAGAVDILAAALINKVSPAMVCRAIASGVLGGGAFSAGPSVVLVGFVFQIVMACFIAALFFVGGSAIELVRRHSLVAGALYGIPVYFVMTYVVVPLSRAKPHRPASLAAAIPDLVAMIVFGLILVVVPLAIAALRASAALSPR